MWTCEVEENIKKEGTKGIRNYWETLTERLNDLVDLVRTKLTI